MEATTNQPPLVVDEYVAAAALGLSVHTLRKDRQHDRRIPFVRIGGSIRYNLDRVRAALDSFECGGPTARTARKAPAR